MIARGLYLVAGDLASHGAGEILVEIDQAIGHYPIALDGIGIALGEAVAGSRSAGIGIGARERERAAGDGERAGAGDVGGKRA